jgi:hypothetical protein
MPRCRRRIAEALAHSTGKPLCHRRTVVRLPPDQALRSQQFCPRTQLSDLLPSEVLPTDRTATQIDHSSLFVRKRYRALGTSPHCRRVRLVFQCTAWRHFWLLSEFTCEPTQECSLLLKDYLEFMCEPWLRWLLSPAAAAPELPQSKYKKLPERSKPLPQRDNSTCVERPTRLLYKCQAPFTSKPVTTGF